MDVITQTNRTILFTEINPECLNLLTLIGDVRGKTSLDDDKIKEINKELTVSSFSDFWKNLIRWYIHGVMRQPEKSNTVPCDPSTFHKIVLQKYP